MRTLFLVMVCGTLSAQYSSVAVYSQIPSFYAATMANMVPLWKQQSIVALYRGVKPGSTTARPPSAGTSVAMREPADFSFPYQKRWTTVDEMAGYLTDSPQERKQVAAQFALLIETVAEDLKQGGTPYDVSKAMMFFTATMYSVVHPEVNLDQPAMDRLLRQFRSELLDPTSLKASPADRTQRQWESLIGIGGLVLMGHEQALQQRNEAALQSIRASAALGLTQLFRVDSRQLRLDPGADFPLSLSEPNTSRAPASQAPAVSSGWGSPGSVPAPVSPGPVASRNPSTGGDAIRLGHYHTISGVHPAELHLQADGLYFDPLGNTCNQAALKVPYADVHVAGVAVNGNSETLLNLRIRDPRNPKKTLNFNFATRDSWNDASSGVPVVRSQAGALEVLRQVSEILHTRGAQ